MRSGTRVAPARILTRWLVVLAPLAAMAFAIPTSSAPVGASHRSGDGLAVYFRHDAVGRNMLRLVATSCGTERWPVKTATDYDRNKIHPQPVDSTINYLRNRQAPSDRPQSKRVDPVEITTYRVHARLVEYKQEADNDYHLVLRDTHGRTMIAEIPAPTCVGRISPERNNIVAARRWFNQHYDATSDYKAAAQQVVVIGVGFFDFLHGQTGVAPNGIELHPVVGIGLG